MQKLMKKFVRDERGVTAIEYGLIAGLVAIAIVGALGTLGTNLSGIFTTVSSSVQSANTTAAAAAPASGS